MKTYIDHSSQKKTHEGAQVPTFRGMVHQYSQSFNTALLFLIVQILIKYMPPMLCAYITFPSCALRAALEEEFGLPFPGQLKKN
jgi:hypothetical protein